MNANIIHINQINKTTKKCQKKYKILTLFILIGGLYWRDRY